MFLLYQEGKDYRRHTNQQAKTTSQMQQAHAPITFSITNGKPVSTSMSRTAEINRCAEESAPPKTKVE